MSGNDPSETPTATGQQTPHGRSQGSGAARVGAGLLAIFLLAFALRVHDLGVESLWLDEVHSFNRASLSGWAEMYRLLLAKNHAPLYDAFLLHNWLRLGQSEFLLRFPTVMASLLTIAVTYALAKRLFNWKIGLISALLLALSQLSLIYAREARMYSLAALFVALAFYYLARAIEPGARRRASLLLLFAFASALALYTHYYTAVALVGACLFAIGWSLFKRDWRLLAGLLASYVAIGLTFAPWLPTFLAQLQHDPVAWIPDRSAGELLRILSWFFLSTAALGASYNVFAVLLAIVLVLGLALCISRVRRSGEQTGTFELLYIATAVLGSILFAVLVSLIKPSILPRYFVPLLAPASILLAIAIVGFVAYRLTALLALLLIIGLSISAYWTSTTITKPDWREIAAFLSANAEPEDAILVAPTNNDVPLKHYFSGPVKQIALVANQTELPSRFADAAAAQRIWTVTVDNEVSRQMIAYAGSQLTLISCQSFGPDRALVDLCLYIHDPPVGFRVRPRTPPGSAFARPSLPRPSATVRSPHSRDFQYRSAAGHTARKTRAGPTTKESPLSRPVGRSRWGKHRVLRVERA